MPAAATRIEGSLVALSERGERIVVTGRGDRLEVRLPGLLYALRNRRRLPAVEGVPLAVLRRLGLRLEVRLGARLVALWAPDRRPSALARLFGWAPFRLALRPATGGSTSPGGAP